MGLPRLSEVPGSPRKSGSQGWVTRCFAESEHLAGKLRVRLSLRSLGLRPAPPTNEWLDSRSGLGASAGFLASGSY